MALGPFPPNPTNGQVVVNGGTKFTYTNGGWLPGGTTTAPNTTTAPANPATPGTIVGAQATAGAQNLVNMVLATGMQLVAQGIPYLWGGTTPKGFDCSGLTQYVFAQNGITIGRTTGDQYNNTSKNPSFQVIPLGGANGLANAQPGDLIFYGMNNASSANQHVGIIYSTSGNGTMIDSAHTGTTVSIDPIFHDATEPVSGIRRYTTGGAGTTPFGSTVTPGSSASGTGNITGTPTLTSLTGTLTSGSFWHEALGIALMIAGAAVGMVALAVLSGKQVPGVLGKMVPSI